MSEENPNAIIKLDSNIQKYDDEAFDAATKAGKYLPRVQLMTSSSEKCKVNEFPINHFALVRDQEHTDIGENVDLALVAWRPKAVKFGEMIITCFDYESDQFKKIAEEAGDGGLGAMSGIEFLVWLAEKQEFATFFMGGKTTRREAPKVKALMHQAATLKPKKIVTPKYTYFSPVTTACSTPMDLPDPVLLSEVVEKFNNPPATEIEEAPETEGEERAR